jgi:hypothetical protein
MATREPAPDQPKAPIIVTDYDINEAVENAQKLYERLLNRRLPAPPKDPEQE